MNIIRQLNKALATAALLCCCTLSSNAQTSHPERYAAHSRLASGKWVKIRVKDAGIYAITPSQLSSMGFKNPAKVSLYGYNLPVLPETDIETLPDDVTEIPLYRRSDNSMLFYSFGTTRWDLGGKDNAAYTHINNSYSDYVYYFLTEATDTVPATLMAKQTEVSDESPLEPVTTFIDHAIYEKDEYSYINTGRTFYENYNFANGKKKTYKMLLPGTTGRNAQICVKFASAGSSASTLQVTANDTTFKSVSYRALGEYEYGIDIAQTFNFDSPKENTDITLTHDRLSGVNGHLDYIAVTYERKLDLAGLSFLTFNSKGSSQPYQLQIDGADKNTLLWCVTAPSQPYEVKGTLSGSRLTATSAAGTHQQYVAFNATGSFPSPEVVGTIANQDLHALANLDLVIIVPANGRLAAQAQRLADAHATYDSLRCAVVRADEIYNEFSSGTPDATAYRRFMKMLYDKAPTQTDRPKNLCLFGDGVWDNRMTTTSMSRKSANDYLLCYESDNSISHTDSYVFEEYYTILADGKGVRPLKEALDCGVGRITVTTEKEAKATVDKLIRYIRNEQTGQWKNTICMLADDGNANIHMKDAEAISEQTERINPDFRISKIYWDSYKREQSATGSSYPAAYNDINRQMDDGALIMNYTGHGAAYCISHEQVVKREDFARWSSPRLPLWIHAACDVSPFDMDEENIGEVALNNPEGGAMGVISTTRTVYSAQNKDLNLNFMKHVLKTKPDGTLYTIGEALAKAKTDIATRTTIGKRDSINKCHFVLLGDPAIHLNMPTYKMVIDQFTGGETVDGSPRIGAGAIVEVSGHIEDESGKLADKFSGTVNPSVFDNLELIKCLNNAGEDIEPFVFQNRVKTLYHGTDSVRNGQFRFSFPVPLDINYSDQSGLLCLYAVNDTHKLEAHGSYDDFTVGGTAHSGDDTQGPDIVIALNGNEYHPQGDDIIECDILLHETPSFTAHLFDESGISTTGSGIGHDISLVIDNDPLLTYNLNTQFVNTIGSWKEGTVSYTIPALQSGQHTLLFRAWDNFNNPSTATLRFNVEAGLQPQIFDLNIKGPVHDMLTLTIENDRPESALDIEVDLFDITGRHIWHATEQGVNRSNYYTFECRLSTSNGHLPPGTYICRASVSTSHGKKASKSKKFIVAQ